MLLSASPSPSITPAAPVLATTLMGRLSGTAKKFGFLPAPDGKSDVFLPPDALMGALHGERVEIEIERVAHDGRRTGRVIRILEPAMPTLVGKIVPANGGGKVIDPLDARFPTLALDPSRTEHAGLTVGTYVHMQLTKRSHGSRLPMGHVLQSWGADLTGPAVAGLASAARGFTAGFSPEALAEAAALGATVQPADRAGRRDLRQLPWVTIDGSSSKDFDDALAAERTDEGWRLWVAIADVAHYVRPGSALDAEAKARGTSVYMPGLVLPMLPPSLSEGLCSLNPGVERLATVAELTFDAQGVRTSAAFCSATIVSKARLTYTQVARWFEDKSPLPVSASDRAAVFKSLEILGKIQESLDGQRQKRGALEFESQEVSVEMDADGRAVGITKEPRTRAHRLVEETMIAANVAASDEVAQHGAGALYRNHGQPCPRRFAAVQSRGQREGVKVGSPARLRVGDLSRMIRKSPGLAPFIRHAQAKACYAPVREGHYGLGLDSYAHFTSPIRRYPDILVHRALKAIGVPSQAAGVADDLTALSLHLSEREAAASGAEREATDRLRMTWLVRQPSSKVWAGTVNGVTRMGLFVTLDDCGGSGLLPMPNVATFDEQHMCWTLDDQEWTLGTSVQVRLEAVDTATLKMTLGWDVIPMPKPSRNRPSS